MAVYGTEQDVVVIPIPTINQQGITEDNAIILGNTIETFVEEHYLFAILKILAVVILHLACIATLHSSIG